MLPKKHSLSSEMANHSFPQFSKYLLDANWHCASIGDTIVEEIDISLIITRMTACTIPDCDVCYVGKTERVLRELIQAEQ